MSLMTEIRSSVEPKDIDRFDDLVLKKEIEIMKVSVSAAQFQRTDFQFFGYCVVFIECHPSFSTTFTDFGTACQN